LIEQLIYQNIIGYSIDFSTNKLKQDPIFKVILDKSSLASQALLSLFRNRISEENISQLQNINQTLKSATLINSTFFKVFLSKLNTKFYLSIFKLSYVGPSRFK